MPRVGVGCAAKHGGGDSSRSRAAGWSAAAPTSSVLSDAMAGLGTATSKVSSSSASTCASAGASMRAGTGGTVSAEEGRQGDGRAGHACLSEAATGGQDKERSPPRDSGGAWTEYGDQGGESAGRQGAATKRQPSARKETCKRQSRGNRFLVSDSTSHDACNARLCTL